MNQGFTLTEVLVSLLLLSGSSMALLKQQWQTAQLINQLHTRAAAVVLLDNILERGHLGDRISSVMAPFKIQYVPLEDSLVAEMSWDKGVYLIKRQMVVG